MYFYKYKCFFVTVGQLNFYSLLQYKYRYMSNIALYCCVYFFYFFRIFSNIHSNCYFISLFFSIFNYTVFIRFLKLVLCCTIFRALSPRGYRYRMLFPIAKKETNNIVSFKKLGYKDSNLEMLESESSALPFGDSPI